MDMNFKDLGCRFDNGKAWYKAAESKIYDVYNEVEEIICIAGGKDDNSGEGLDDVLEMAVNIKGIITSTLGELYTWRLGLNARVNKLKGEDTKGNKGNKGNKGLIDKLCDIMKDTLNDIDNIDGSVIFNIDKIEQLLEYMSEKVIKSGRWDIWEKVTGIRDNIKIAKVYIENWADIKLEEMCIGNWAMSGWYNIKELEETDNLDSVNSLKADVMSLSSSELVAYLAAIKEVGNNGVNK